MTLLGVLADAHGNARGMNLVLNEFEQRGVEEVVFLGDAFGYFPDWRGVVELIDDRVDHWIMGNHEAMLAGLIPISPGSDQIHRLTEVREDIEPSLLERILALPRTLEYETEMGAVRFFHGSPDDPLSGRIYPDTPLPKSKLSGLVGLFLANTHRPFCRKERGVFVTNVGSCGLPRDVGYLASGAIWEIGSRIPELVRISLDVQELKARYTGRVHPDVLAILDRDEGSDRGPE